MTMQSSAACIVYKRSKSLGPQGLCSSSSNFRVISLMSLRGLTEKLEELYLCGGIGALMSMLRSLERLWVTVEVMPLKALRERSKTGGKAVRELWSVHKGVEWWRRQEKWNWSILEYLRNTSLAMSIFEAWSQFLPQWALTTYWIWYSVFIVCNINPVMGTICISKIHATVGTARVRVITRSFSVGGRRHVK